MWDESSNLILWKGPQFLTCSERSEPQIYIRLSETQWQIGTGMSHSSWAGSPMLHSSIFLTNTSFYATGYHLPGVFSLLGEMHVIWVNYLVGISVTFLWSDFLWKRVFLKETSIKRVDLYITPTYHLLQPHILKSLIQLNSWKLSLVESINRSITMQQSWAL